MVLKPNSREEWLKERKRGIGGSDAGAVLGVNKYKSNLEVYQEKTGIKEPDDISDKPAVMYGKQAEEHIRAMFTLDYPQYSVDYHEFWMYVHDAYDFMYATLDGELTDTDGNRGILEIKTTYIQNQKQWDDWNDRIPDSYYVQVLHQLACTGWDFAVLRAYIRYVKDGELRATVRDYFIDAKDVRHEIQHVVAKECQFWERVVNLSEPPLILPSI